MPGTRAERWERHNRLWSTCDKCELKELRCAPVLFRGWLYAPIMFIGEAPGASEDIDDRHRPFVGDAGKQLDKMIRSAGIPEKLCCFTNILACIPLADAQTKVSAPSFFPESVKACTPRLQQIFDIVQPRAVVFAGKEAGQFGPYILGAKRIGSLESVVEILHPAAILRADATQQGLAIQKTVIHLSDLKEELEL